MSAVLRRVLLGRRAAQTRTLRSLSTRTKEEEKTNQARLSSLIKKSETLDSDLDFVQTAFVMIENIDNFMIFNLDRNTIMDKLNGEIKTYPLSLEKYPQADSIEVFQARIKRRRQSPNDSNNGDITKDQIISRVLDVIKLYPKYDQTRLHMPEFLMNGGHFVRDFGLDLEAWKEIVRALETEFMPDFKLEPIPQEIESANLIVDYIYENIRLISCKGDPTEDQIYSLASLVIRVVIDLTQCDHGGGLYKPFDVLCLIRGITAFKNFPVLSKLRLISTVFDGIQNHPGVKKLTVYHMRLYIKSVKKDDCKDDLTRNDISIRALAVIKDNPVVVDYRSKVTEDSYFHNDLNLTKNEQEEVIYGLSLEFKLDIPSNMESCKQAIDYIYDHRLTRLSLTDFDEKVGYGLVY